MTHSRHLHSRTGTRIRFQQSSSIEPIRRFRSVVPKTRDQQHPTSHCLCTRTIQQQRLLSITESTNPLLFLQTDQRQRNTKNIPTMSSLQSDGGLSGSGEGDGSSDPCLPPFTREDEKELFSDDTDPNFVADFRDTYCDSNDSCPLLFEAHVVKVSVNEIENRALNRQWNAREVNVYDTYAKTLKLPASIARMSTVVQDSDDQAKFEDLMSRLANRIMHLQWKKILRKNPNRYHCLVCAKPSVTCDAVIQNDLSNANRLGVHMLPCFPLCARGRCRLIARKCMDKYFPSSFPVGASVASCANCSQHDVAVERKLMICARCKVVYYCNAACQKAHWSVHRKACKLVSCQQCAKLETSTKFPKCSRCQKVFYCGRDCQSADWANHKNICNYDSR
jgi:hypothetical protein